MKRATYLAVGEKKPRRKGDKRAKNGQKSEINDVKMSKKAKKNRVSH